MDLTATLLTNHQPHLRGASKTAIFHGLSFWMTGRTCLPDQELKRIIVEHGGALAGNPLLNVEFGMAN